MTMVTLEQALQTALTQHRAGQLPAAEAIYRQILAVQPQHPEALHLLGALATEQQRYDEAVPLLQRAVTLVPMEPVFHSNLGVALRRMGRLEEATASLQRAATLGPQIPETHLNFSDALLDLGRYHEAMASARRALALRPDYGNAYNNLGNALAQLGRFEEAVESHRQAVALCPENADAHNNLGNSLMEAGQWDEAIVCFERALELLPGCAEALANLGLSAVCRGHPEEALAFYRRALEHQPDFAGAHWNYALLLLQIGHYEEGWREYEWRWRSTGFPSPRRNFPVPPWDGRPAPGATILLHIEQGYGDAIQFMRYVPQVRERAGAQRVVVECPESLARLFEQSGGWNAEIVVRRDWEGTGLPPFDFHLPLLSLPLVLSQFEPLPMKKPYLRVDPAARDAWRERLQPGLRVGIVWAGSKVHRYNARRSMAAEKLLPVLRVPGVSVYSLQVGPPPPPTLVEAGLIDFTAHITDFADTAALMAELDVIISADTAPAHLAGALGLPVWTLVPFIPDWRWGSAGETTPWYPNMRLFRQCTIGDWDDVIARVVSELERTRG